MQAKRLSEVAASETNIGNLAKVSTDDRNERPDGAARPVFEFARLGEEDKKPDYRAGFRGLREASAALMGRARPIVPSALAPALPRWPGRNRL
jgi:hypothetical protein